MSHHEQNVIASVDPATLKEWLEEESVLLIDVRSPEEYRAGHIKSAVNIPLAAINENIAQLDKRLVFQCARGHRSAQAVDRLSESRLDPHDSPARYSLTGGLENWKEHGHEVIHETEKAGRSIEQQVQLTVGILVLATLLLGFLIHPAFYLVTAAIGAGLLNAGLTGWCGMAKLLMKMPWNKN